MGFKAIKGRVLSHRHDFLFLFDVVDRSPGHALPTVHQPGWEGGSGYGIISDASLKRRIRNVVERMPLGPRGGEREPDGNSYHILLRDERRAGLDDSLERRFARFAKNRAWEIPGERGARHPLEASGDPAETLQWLCREFYDVRAFGCVLSHGHRTMKGSAWGQLRGPVQLTFGRSLHPVLRLSTAGRPGAGQAGTAISADAGQAGSPLSTFDRGGFSYALYAARGYVSPFLAARTGFTEEDLLLLFTSLVRLFEGGVPPSRGEMTVRGLYDFEHIGTQGRRNTEQNRREARLGCAPCQDLFGGIEIVLQPGREIPLSFADYQVTCLWETQPLPAGIQLHKRHEAPLQP